MQEHPAAKKDKRSVTNTPTISQPAVDQLTQKLADALWFHLKHHSPSYGMRYSACHRYVSMTKTEFKRVLKVLIDQKRVQFEQHMSSVIIIAVDPAEGR